MRFTLPSLLAPLLTLAPPAAADPVLVQPIDCTLGESCYIQHYVDRDAGPLVRDYGCGSLSYDGHKGTDFALRSLNQMAQGVDILAAAPGVVRGVRDGMADQIYTINTAAEVEGRECGNGVAIDHGGGWISQYCHMKQGSVVVERGQRVAANAVLGQVGLSGKTQFPHLHISLRQNGEVTDPFGPTGKTCNAEPTDTLWQDTPPYQAGGLIDAGFAIRVPEYTEIKAGDAHVHQLDQSAPALVGWAYGYGTLKGDVMQITLSGPAGTVIDKRILLKKSQAQMFRAVGRRRPDGGWDAGHYRTVAKLIRKGEVVDQREVWLELR